MAKASKWRDPFVAGLVNGDATAVRKSISLGLPLREYVFGDKSHTPLHEALNFIYGDAVTPELLRLLLDAGAEVDARLREGCFSLEEGMTPLMLSAADNRPDRVRLFLAAGADANAADDEGRQVLWHAAFGASSDMESKKVAERRTARAEEIVTALLAAGARPDALSLAAAADRGSPPMIRQFLAAGAEVDGISKEGTPLQMAVAENRLANVEALLAAGADPDLKAPDQIGDGGPMSAVDVARNLKRKKLLPLLMAAAERRREVRCMAAAATPLPHAERRR